MTGQRIAVVGGGISGNLVARMLAARHDVKVFEAAHYLGGHANTVDVRRGERTFPVDTGFMVFNARNYPNFLRMLERLEVESQPSDMSFSVQCERSGLMFQGSSLNGLFAQRSNLIRPRFYRVLWDVLRFNRTAERDVAADPDVSLGEFLDRRDYSEPFRNHYLLPMSAAIWSCPPNQMRAFPARFLVSFFRNHGLLQLRDRPQWRTIVGGSRIYVERLLAPIADRIECNCPVEKVVRSGEQVLVQPRGRAAESFDQVVIAAHADQALAMLADADETERQVLGAFPYQRNDAVLHTDASLLPRTQRAWASWNYHIAQADAGRVSVSYDLSRLQRHDSGDPILLTLNPQQAIDPAKIERRMVYHHPAYGSDAFAAQTRHIELVGRRRTSFCGAYWGYGFHEDGVNSALTVGRHFDVDLDACKAASTRVRSDIVVPVP